MRSKAGILVIYTVLVIAGTWFLNEYLEPETPVKITPGPVVDNHEQVDVYKLKIAELRQLVDCYANQAAYLELFMVDDTTMRAEAGLCERKWHRDARITAEALKNYVIINGLLPAGIQGSYYRRVGPVAIGGGVQYQETVGIHAGILYGF